MKVRLMMRWLIAVATAFAGCARGLDANVLELRDVQGFSVNEMHRGDFVVLRLSGLVFHSALGVDRFEQRIVGGTLEVRAVLTLANKSRSGLFDLELELPRDVRRVVFGNEKVEVWPRRLGGP